MPIDESDHPSFERPPAEASLWRYIDLPKYLSMLAQNALWFSRADLLGDPFEGSMSNMNVLLRPAVYDGKIPAHALRQMEEIRRHAVRHHFVSC